MGSPITRKPDCRYYRFGRCLLAEQIGNVQPAPTWQEACDACQREGTPETGTPNYMVASVALQAAKDTPRFPDVMDGVRQYLRAFKQTGTGDLLQALPCEHRGNQTGSQKCRLCGGEGRLEPVYSCAVHVSATLRKWKNGRQPEAVCLICPEREV
jgi:hypothetical protein